MVSCEFVLVHGGVHTGRAWAPLMPHLAAPAVAVDLPGRGASPAELRALTLETFIDGLTTALHNSEAERIDLSKKLVELIRGGFVKPDEGDIQHFVLLALGRVWQVNPAQGKLETQSAKDARADAMKLLLEMSNAPQPKSREAALSGMRGSSDCSKTAKRRSGRRHERLSYLLLVPGGATRWDRGRHRPCGR